MAGIITPAEAARRRALRWVLIGGLVFVSAFAAFLASLSRSRVLLVLTFTPMALGLILFVAGAVEGARASGRSVSRAQWRADPMGRHQARYWDGTGWTARVRDAGAIAEDPIAVGALEGEAS